MTDKSEKRLSAIAHLHNALYLISRQKLFAAYASICRALEDSGEKLEAPEAIFERFARICAGEEVNAEVQEINAELRKVTMNIPARFRGEPPRAYLLYIGEDERNTCYVRIKPTGRMTVFYDEECKHWRAEYDTKSKKTEKESDTQTCQDAF